MGSIERVNRDTLQVIRAMILEYRVQGMVYFVSLAATPLNEFYLPDGRRRQTIPVSAEIDGYLMELRDSIQSMYCAMEDQRLKQWIRNKKRDRGVNLLAKEIRVLVTNYVARTDAQSLREHWQALRGDQGHELAHREQRSVQEVRPSVGSEQVPVSSELRGPQGGAGQLRPRLTGIKWQHRAADRSKQGRNIWAGASDSHADERQASGDEPAERRRLE
ncbi:hypothetical protein PC111_g18008 [Phytophthora cactorum]|nr:hypothetical protein PC111_g18008 [Phytophthora cactorum]KAG3131589.1 hypothetical protein C6341_g23281 [Phytophthora cactorum]